MGDAHWVADPDLMRDIAGLKQEAGEAGDAALVATCERALAGDREAAEQCDLIMWDEFMRKLADGSEVRS